MYIKFTENSDKYRTHQVAELPALEAAAYIAAGVAYEVRFDPKGRSLPARGVGSEKREKR